MGFNDYFDMNTCGMSVSIFENKADTEMRILMGAAPTTAQCGVLAAHPVQVWGPLTYRALRLISACICSHLSIHQAVHRAFFCAQ